MMPIVTALAPCPKTPNCVSTESTDPAHRIEPIPYSASLAVARARLIEVLRATPGATVRQAALDRLDVEFRTRLLRFVDDAVFVFDEEAKQIRFRSASRVGRWDLGTNRRRMEGIRRAFLGRKKQKGEPSR
jgi:uncharacterized protein (DUF1499 family)